MKSISDYNTQLVDDPDVLSNCYRLRYEIYVEEMHRKQFHADHKNRIIKDALDDSSFTFACFHTKTNNLVGTIRSNVITNSRPAVDPYLELYQINKENLDFVSITTRLMIKKEHRTLNALNTLVCAIYNHCLINNISLDYMDCNTPLPKVAERYGYKSHLTNVMHPEYGYVQVMKLDVGNIQYLEKIGSPFAKLAIAKESTCKQ